MLPGINPRQMQQMMRKMGIQQVEIPATEVIIKTKEKLLIISNPSVSKVNMMGQESIQILGEIVEQNLPSLPEISEEDITTIQDQTGVDKETARKALEKNKGDLAATILYLTHK